MAPPLSQPGQGALKAELARELGRGKVASRHPFGPPSDTHRESFVAAWSDTNITDGADPSLPRCTAKDRARSIMVVNAGTACTVRTYPGDLIAGVATHTLAADSAQLFVVAAAGAWVPHA